MALPEIGFHREWIRERALRRMADQRIKDLEADNRLLIVALFEMANCDKVVDKTPKSMTAKVGL